MKRLVTLVVVVETADHGNLQSQSGDVRQGDEAKFLEEWLLASEAFGTTPPRLAVAEIPFGTVWNASVEASLALKHGLGDHDHLPENKRPLYCPRCQEA